MIQIPVPEDEKIDFTKPTFTLDVNLVALRPPALWPQGLPHLEWNYFETELVELCVTPETTKEILQGRAFTEIGSTAYKRFQKSEWFKRRPPGTILEFNRQQADEVWLGLRKTLFPSVSDSYLTQNHMADVTQVFHHLAVSGTLANSAFLTMDYNFLNHGTELNERFGIQVLRPDKAWEIYAPQYQLVTPTPQQIDTLWQRQSSNFQHLSNYANYLSGSAEI